MGRKKIYETEDERLEAKRLQRMRYYEANKIEERRKARERYHANKDITENGGIEYIPYENE